MSEARMHGRVVHTLPGYHHRLVGVALSVRQGRQT
jgi:hypothetical protein